MKVLEAGKVKEDWTIQHRCTGWGRNEEGCDALLEIDFDDLRYQPGCRDYRCESDPHVSFRCPCCGEVTDIGTNDWPKNYRKLKEWTYNWHFGNELLRRTD